MGKSRNSVMFLEGIENVDLLKIKKPFAIDFSIVLDHMINAYRQNNLTDLADNLEKYHGMISEDMCEIVTIGFRQAFQDSNIIFKNSHMVLEEMKAKGKI